MAQIDETRLEAIIGQQISLAKDHDSREREKDRSKSLDYYLGNMDRYVPSEPNRSKVISRDVADTMGWIMPQMMRVFTASDKMAIAEPVGLKDTQFARDATDGLNYVFWKDNKGYEVVYNATWDSLLFGNGIVKTYYDDDPVYETSFHSGLDEEQRALLLTPETDDEEDDTDEPEVLAQDERTIATIDPATGMEISQTFYDLKIKRKKAKGRFVIECIPPEKFLIDQDAICTDDAAFTAHWDRKTRSELVMMGYDKATVAAIPEAGSYQSPEESSRTSQTNEQEADSSMELVDYYECYIRIDINDDGEAELIRACFAGPASGKLLDWEEWEDENPFDDIPCEPIPHRWTARSISDETMDVQDIKTVLLRQGLNNVYWVNNPQLFAKGKFQNPDALLNPTFGGVVFGDANAEVSPLEVPFVAKSAFDAIAYQDEVVQRRTGVGRSTMALDPEALQNQTATASQNMKDAGYSQIELLARNMAEWGWSKVFRKLLRLMIKHQDHPRLLMINNKPTQIDPRHWNADMAVSINVGLGTGSRDRDLIMLRQILETQVMMADRFMAAGATEDAIDMLPKILQTTVRMAESAGIRNPEEYYPEYNDQKVMQLKQMAQQAKQQGDPKVALEAQKLQADIKGQAMKLQADAQSKQAEMQMKSAQMEQEFSLKQQQLMMEMDLRREQLAAELQLKRELSMAELALKRELGVISAAQSAANVSSSVRAGGEPG